MKTSTQKGREIRSLSTKKDYQKYNIQYITSAILILSLLKDIIINQRPTY